MSPRLVNDNGSTSISLHLYQVPLTLGSTEFTAPRMEISDTRKFRHYATFARSTRGEGVTWGTKENKKITFF